MILNALICGADGCSLWGSFCAQLSLGLDLSRSEVGVANRHPETTGFVLDGGGRRGGERSQRPGVAACPLPSLRLAKIPLIKKKIIIKS